MVNVGASHPSLPVAKKAMALLDRLLAQNPELPCLAKTSAEWQSKVVILAPLTSSASSAAAGEDAIVHEYAASQAPPLLQPEVSKAAEECFGDHGACQGLVVVGARRDWRLADRRAPTRVVWWPGAVVGAGSSQACAYDELVGAL